MKLGYLIFLLIGAIVFPAPFPLSAQQTSLTDKERAARDAQSLSIPAGYRENLHWDLNLDTAGKNGSIITWKSGNPAYISHKGKLLKQPPAGKKKAMVTMTATIAAGSVKQTRRFDVSIAPEEPRKDGYLFAYFEGSGKKNEQEQLRFAASADGIHWNALNNNLPILASADIAATGGIRDPHILRGEDGKTCFLTATDMYTVKDGWQHNPGIVLLQSKDLINWTHGIIDLEKQYPEKFKNIQWVWAPQTIYDPAANKYLVYFTVKRKDDPALDFYCAYANEQFNGFEGVPQLLFKPKYGAIDGDIIYENGLYHFFYKGNTKNEQGKEIANGIQQATAKTLQGPWVEDFIYVDAYSVKKTSVEGSGIFKLNNGEGYVLMYDLYRDHRYEFQRSADLFHFTQNPESFTKNFNPRHGTVMGITREEAKRLNDEWGGVPEALLTQPNTQPAAGR